MTPETCARSVMETVPQVMRLMRSMMRRHRAAVLSVPQFRAMAFVNRHPGACLYHLADHLGVTRPTASVIAERLVQRGLLARATDPRERRRIALSLTPEGERQLEQARHATRSEIAKVLAPLPAEALDRIARGLGLLSGAVRAVAGLESEEPRRRRTPAHR
jgi:DNA-binding MarR family transcriptional regulator